MDYIGNILKMKSSLGDVVKYELPLAANRVDMNALIGKQIRFSFLNEINCVKCGATTKKSFAQGFCYPCFMSAPETESCVLRPETCQAHNGIARDMAWAEEHCLADQYVYLALSSGLKVGVTRATQIPTRWIDQGAWKAIKLAKAPNRHTAGLIEVELKAHMADKTNWRKMLTNNLNFDVDLLAEKDNALNLLPEDFHHFVEDDDTITEIEYPVENYPEKVKSVGFDKNEIIEGVLAGIKGQYLIFEDNTVLNIRKHGGYYVRLTVD